MNFIQWIAALLMLVALFPAQTPAQTAQPDMDEFSKAMAAMMAGNTNVAVVDFRELKALLPAELPGLKRAAASGEKTSAMGMTVSFAEGRYENDQGASVTVKISDNGGIGGLMAFAQSAWAMSEIDRETDTGFERTTKYGEYKAHEEYDNEGRQGSIDILVGGRFIVEIRGSDAPWVSLQAAA